MVVLHFLFFNIFLVVWRVNCSHTGEGELQFAPTRVLSERWQILYANSITGMA